MHNFCMSVNWPLIQQQALKFAKYLNNDTLKASNGWLYLLLKRNDIVFRTMTVERGDVDTTTYDDWKKHLLHYVRGTALKTFSIWMKQDCYS